MVRKCNFAKPHMVLARSWPRVNLKRLEMACPGTKRRASGQHGGAPSRRDSDHYRL